MKNLRPANMSFPSYFLLNLLHQKISFLQSLHNYKFGSEEIFALQLILPKICFFHQFQGFPSLLTCKQVRRGTTLSCAAPVDPTFTNSGSFMLFNWLDYTVVLFCTRLNQKIYKKYRNCTNMKLCQLALPQKQVLHLFSVLLLFLHLHWIAIKHKADMSEM